MTGSSTNWLPVSLDLFLRDGFAVVPAILGERECAAVAESVDAFVADAPGMRSLLIHGWCRELAASLRAHPKVGALIPGWSLGRPMYVFREIGRQELACADPSGREHPGP